MAFTCRRVVVPVLLTAAALIVALAIAVRAQGPTFDAVSIKRHVGPFQPGLSGYNPGRFRFTSTPLSRLVVYAWGAPMGLKGAPGWLMEELYDVDIVWPPDTPSEQLEQMWKTMVAERLKLQVHYEEIDDPSFYLVVARPDGRLGKGLTRSPVDCDAVWAARKRGESVPARPNGVGPCSIQVSGDTVTAGGITMGDLAPQLIGLSGRQVVDRTGLEGRWEFSIHYSRIERDPNAPPGLYPSIFSALQDELGLKLVPFTGRNKLLVVDHVERPTQN